MPKKSNKKPATKVSGKKPSEVAHRWAFAASITAALITALSGLSGVIYIVHNQKTTTSPSTASASTVIATPISDNQDHTKDANNKLPIKKISSANIEPPASTQLISADRFYAIRKNADLLKVGENYADAYREYEKAYTSLPNELKSKVKADLVKEARSSFHSDRSYKYKEAATLFANALEGISYETKDP